MKKLFISVGQQQCHLRTSGKGPVVVLFHASPSSSAMLVPLMQKLGSKFTLIAPDTPGYGLSDPLPEPSDDLIDYVKHFRELFAKLKLKKFALYGTATGAQIAIRYALEYPDQVSHLYLDNAAHFDDALRTAILENYFPDLSPKSDGSHLQQLWTMVRGLFEHFPWSMPSEENRLSSPLPPASVLHQVATDFLQAGPEYFRAYRAAFVHERAAYVQQLKVPTTIFNWAGSIIQPYIQQLIDHDLPNNVSVCNIAADKEKRYTQMSNHIVKTYTASKSFKLVIPRNQQLKGQRYCKSPFGQLHAYFNFTIKEQPFLMIPAQYSASDILRPVIIQEWSQERAVISISPPGYGNSAPAPESTEALNVNKVLQQAMLNIGIEKYDVFSLPPSTPPMPLVPDAEGSYLINAWFTLKQIMRNAAPEQLQVHLLAWMKARH